jgi:uncharacterized SAM-binding protein YcdF (DUF218 family)
MDLMYVARKLLSELARPSTFLVILFVASTSIALFWRPGGKRFRLVAAMSGGALFVLSFMPVSSWIMASLERQYAPFDSATLRDPPSAIVVLGGISSSPVIYGATSIDLKDAMDRVRHAAALARQFPGSQVILSGGGDGPAGPESKVMAELLHEFGIARERMILETRSRTTAENARFVREIVKGEAPILLVTSASHMPRAMANFRIEEVNAIAAPTDWQVSDGFGEFFTGASASLSRLDLATHEYLGLVALWVFGPGHAR